MGLHFFCRSTVSNSTTFFVDSPEIYVYKKEKFNLYSSFFWLEMMQHTSRGNPGESASAREGTAHVDEEMLAGPTFESDLSELHPYKF